jgi:hypothetical protein
MAWLSLDDDSITSALSGPELDALRTAALESGQPDPVEAVLQQVARLVRGKCAAAGIALGTGISIPDELVLAATSITRFNCLTRLPGMVFLQDDWRKTAHADGLKLLDQVASGDFAVVPAITEAPEDEQAGAAVPVFEGRTKMF